MYLFTQPPVCKFIFGKCINCLDQLYEGYLQGDQSGLGLHFDDLGFGDSAMLQLAYQNRAGSGTTMSKSMKCSRRSEWSPCMIFRVSNFRVSKQQILLELNDLIDIAKPMKENGSGQTMSSKKAKSHGMKLTVMEDEMSILGLSDSRKETSVGLDQFRQIRCVRAPSLKAVNYRAPQQRLFLDCVQLRTFSFSF